MKKLVATLAIASSSALMASDLVEYSVAEYCDLKDQYPSSIVQKNIVKAYENKLGFKPTKAQCTNENNLKLIGYAYSSKKWDYFHNKPYRGSAIRLSQNQVKKLRALNISQQEMMQLFSSVDK